MTHKKLPEFRNEKEFIEFVETHSLADYWDEFEPVEDVQIQTRHQAKKRISLQVYPSLLEGIKKIAVQRGISCQALIQRWLGEKLRQAQTGSSIRS